MVRHRIDGLEKIVINQIKVSIVRHRIDGLEIYPIQHHQIQ